MNAGTQASTGVPDVAGAGASITPPPPPPAAPSPQYTPPPSPMPSQPMADGGSVASGSAPRKNPFKNFFADINVVDVAISAFVVGAVIYSIQYHKFMIMMEKTGYADLSTRLNRVENDVATAKKKAAEANANGQNKFGRRKRGLISF